MFQEAYKSCEEQPDRMTGAEGTKESMRLENSKNIDISVIMPVYNSGNYLEQSLSSLTGQTLDAYQPAPWRLYSSLRDISVNKTRRPPVSVRKAVCFMVQKNF